MAKRKNAAARPVSAPPISVPAERASEIRVRDHAPVPEDERDTLPAPPPAFDAPIAPWSDLDRDLTLDQLRLEDLLYDYGERGWATHVAAVLEDVEALADGLFALWGQSRRERASWRATLPRVYQWLRDVLAEVNDAIELDAYDREMGRAFGRIASYSSLLVDGLVRPALATAMTYAEEAGDDEELERLRVVHERICLLKWTLACAARLA